MLGWAPQGQMAGQATLPAEEAVAGGNINQARRLFSLLDQNIKVGDGHSPLPERHVNVNCSKDATMQLSKGQPSDVASPRAECSGGMTVRAP